MTEADSSRLVVLDGLRGVAAVVVVLHHALLLSPAVAAAYLHPASGHPPRGSATWWLLETPLTLVVAGQEAVLVFFVISGLVLTLPAARPGFDWFAYFPRRLVRLLLPVSAAVVLAALWYLLTPQVLDGVRSEWLTRQLLPGFSAADPVLAMDLLSGRFTIDNPLWSLRYELFFSMLLPLAVVVAVLCTSASRTLLVCIAALVVAGVGWAAGADSFAYLPAFVLGAAMMPVASRLASGPAAGRARLGLLLGWPMAVALTLAYWIGWWAGASPGPAVPVLRALSFLGAAGIVVLSIATPAVRRLLGTRALRMAGRFSFGLYLVHVPMLAGIARLLPADRWYFAALVGVPASFVVAIVFTRWVDEPAHRLARRVGRRSAAFAAHADTAVD